MTGKQHISKPNFIPLKDEFKLGEVIRCISNGFPEPSYSWRDLKHGLTTYGHTLNTTALHENAAYAFECVAVNEIGGKALTASSVIVFGISRRQLFWFYPERASQLGFYGA